MTRMSSEVELGRLLEHEALVDERLEDLARNAHLLFELLRELVSVHAPVVLLGEVEGAVVLGERDRVAVHTRRVRPSLGGALLRAAEAHVDVNETDNKSCDDREKDPLEVVEAFAH